MDPPLLLQPSGAVHVLALRGLVPLESKITVFGDRAEVKTSQRSNLFLGF
jgi:hypothetical protein